VGDALARLASGGAPLVMLSGSGGACFALDPAAPVPGAPVVDSTSQAGWLSVHTSTLTTVPPVVV
jgi:4-diphosphocytidyl-2C-methyl-D-erythritol kinase